jgi:hypothetical protein
MIFPQCSGTTQKQCYAAAVKGSSRMLLLTSRVLHAQTKTIKDHVRCSGWEKRSSTELDTSAPLSPTVTSCFCLFATSRHRSDRRALFLEEASTTSCQAPKRCVCANCDGTTTSLPSTNKLTLVLTGDTLRKLDRWNPLLFLLWVSDHLVFLRNRYLRR